ncbi:MAG: hypothetical protein HGA53_07080 [Anaerolineaceae bacterium]|nr:hypothetical protein [Anaerolineaceae bacterium]
MNTYLLAEVFPWVRKIRLPVSRDQVMLLMIAVNLIFLGIDTYLAHLISGTIVLREWIPILFGPIAGVFMLFAGLIAIKRRFTANLVATVVLLCSVAVGLLGSFYHWIRAILPLAASGEKVAISMIVWAPPLLGPITFALVGILGLSAAWQEDEPGSGRLLLPGNKILRLPLSKTRAYFFLTAAGMLFTVVSSVLDHAHSNFENPWVWIPSFTGVFATIVILALGFIERPTKADLITYIATMVFTILVGILGFGLHINQNIIRDGTIVMERFLRGAPFLAPLLFANMGMIGLIVLLDASEKSKTSG